MMTRVMILWLVLATPSGASAAVTGYFLEIESYDLDVEILPEDDLINVRATLEISNHTLRDLDILDVYLHYRAEVHSAEFNGVETKFEEEGLRADEIRQVIFHPKPPVPVDETFTVTLDYSVAYLQRGGSAQIEPGATHLLPSARWVPFLHQHHSEYGIDYAPTHMRVTVPAGETVVLQGKAIGVDHTETHSVFECQTALSAMPVLLVGDFRTVEVTADGAEAVGHLYADMDPAADEAMRTLLAQGLEIGEFFSGVYGPLPESPLRIVASDSGGGHGFPRCLVLERKTFDFEGDIDLDTFNFLAHEIAHSWFPGYLRPRARGSGIMTEALATYSAALAVEHFRGEDDGVTMWRRSQDRCATARQTIPLLEEITSSSLTYHKGAYWWRTLERRLGRERLHGLLRTFTQENALSAVAFDDMFAWLDEQTPESDLVPLFNWFLRTSELVNVGIEGEPRTWPREGGGVTAELELVTTGHEGLPFDIEVRLEGGEVVEHTAEISAAGRLRVELALDAEPVEVSLDPGRWLLQSHYADDRWPRQRDAQAFYHLAAAAWRGDFPEEGLEPIAQALARQPDNPQFLLMAGLLLLDTEDASGALALLERALEHADESDTSVTRAWVFVALGHACQAIGAIDDAKAYWFQVPANKETRRAHAEAQIRLRAVEREEEIP